MQIIVLGMHRSGTSVITRLITMMGAYFGPNDVATQANEENPKGFWERTDIRRVNDELLKSLGADWDRPLRFNYCDVPVPAKERIRSSAKRIVTELDTFRPWVAKEPRFCLTLPLWREVLECPVAVIVHRSPVEIAYSLKARNGFPLSLGIALWDAYMRRLFRNAKDIPFVVVRHADVFQDPVGAGHRLCRALRENGVKGLSPPSREEIEGFVEPALYRHRHDEEEGRQLLTESQRELNEAVARGSLCLAPVSERISHAVQETLSAHERKWETARQMELARKQEKERMAELERAREIDEARVIDLEQKLERDSARVRELEQLLEEEEERMGELERASRDEQSRSSYLQKQLDDRAQRLKRIEARLQKKHRQLVQVEGELGTIGSWASVINNDIQAIRDSARWRIGNAVIRSLETLLRRPHPGTALDHIDSIAQRIEERARTGVDPSMLTGASSSLSPTFSESRRYNLTVAVIAWDIGHNPLGRAYLLADALSRHFNVVLLGPSFPKYGYEVWEPLRNAKIQTIPLPGSVFPEFLDILETVASRLEADAIVACKARLPSMLLGLVAKAALNRPLFFDIDDYELSFFENRRPLTEDELPKVLKDESAIYPFGEIWTRFSENLIGHADEIFVSNKALQKRFGGTLVPHARDERRFDPSLYDRDAVRSALGFHKDDKIILFVGTPRPHKGVIELLNGIRSTGDPSIKLCVVGSATDPAFSTKLNREIGEQLVLIPNQPFERLPEILAGADAVCLLQNPDSEISQYQLPAKVIDGIAMGIPVLATRVPPLEPLINAGVVEPVTRDNLAAKIESLFCDGDRPKQPSSTLRETFLQDYSYKAIAESLRESVLRHLDAPKELKRSSLEFVNAIRPHKSRAGLDDTDGLTIVLFWKQNDTGLYGRRSDMFVKYLAARPEVARVVVFDLPISIEALRANSGRSAVSHDRDIYRETMLRRWGVRDDGKVTYDTFVYSTNKKDSSMQRWKWPPKGAYLKFVAERLKALGIEPKSAVFWFYPKNEDIPSLWRRFRPRYTVVDIVDDHRAWPGLSEDEKEWLSRHYRGVLGLADLAIANCESVQRQMTQFKSDIMLVPNACETNPPEPPRTDAFEAFRLAPGPKLGYVGNMEAKIDISLLKAVAESNPRWQLYLIGSTHANPDVLELQAYENVHFVGVLPYEEARGWTTELDVALIPHLDSEQTRAMNPLKLYVYTALNVPVVSTRVANLGPLKNYVYIADSSQQFIQMIKAALKTGKTRSKELAQCVEEHSWPKRVDDVLTRITRDIEPSAPGASKSGIGPRN